MDEGATVKRRSKGAYPPDWPDIARKIKDLAGWRCVRCNHPHEPENVL
jgi:hypothetical protein